MSEEPQHLNSPHRRHRRRARSKPASALCAFAGVLLATLLLPLSSPAWGAQIIDQRLDLQSIQRRNLRFSYLTTEHGLSQNSVLDIVQDRQGYIWIGTQEGLNRYDGHDIRLFERDAFDSTSLSHNWIWALMIDAQGQLWVGTDGGGINRYNSDSETFTAIRHDPNNRNSLSSDRTSALFQDSIGDYWVGTVNAGLNRINGETGKITRFVFDENDPGSLPHNSILTIYEDNRNRLWIGTDGGGLARYDRSSNEFIRYQKQSATHSLSNNSVAAILEDRDGWLWVGTRDGGLNRLDTETGKFQRYMHSPEDPTSLSNNFVRDILQDRDGTLWIATDKGINEWHATSNGFARYYSKDGDTSSLSDNRLSVLYQSADGVLWVGSYLGVNKWNFLSDAFTHYRKEDGALGADVVTSIAESSLGELWIGTYGGGMTRIDRLSGQVSIYKHDPLDPDSLSDNRIMAVFIDRQDIVWAGTRGDGLNRLDPVTGVVERIVKPTLSSNRISAIYGDPDGTLWVGTFGAGLNRIGTDGTVEWFKHEKADSTTIGGNRVLAIMRDSSGTLWIGTENGGINRFVEETKKFVRYRHNPADPNSLSSNAAWEVYETSDGSLWVATMSDGLNQWMPRDRAEGREVFKKWSKADGLRSSTVYGLLEDDSGNLWVSTNGGISKLNYKSGEIRHYDRRNGLIGDEYNLGARARSRTGQLLFGGSEGVVAFVPGQIRRSETIPPITLSGFSPLQRLGVRHSGGANSDPVVLKYTDNFVAFEFAALDYTSPDKNDYRYMLEGFDKNWLNPGRQRRITYANLSPGDYVFRVKAANNDGMWNEDGAVMRVHVEPPPWGTTQAYALYFVMWAALVMFILRRIRANRAADARQREQLEHEVAQRTSELGERNRQLEDLNEKLMQASFTDSLTELYNRRYLDQFIDGKIAEVDRESSEMANKPGADFEHYQQSVLFFMMIDLDGFKAINDNFGHAAGDLALLQVRDELLDCTRKSDTVIRWGGDEFLIIGHTKGISGIANFAERVRLAVSERTYRVGNGQTAHMSCSVGAVPYPFAPLQPKLLTWEQALNIADSAAYIVKSNGRNGWVVLSGSNSIDLSETASLPGSLEKLVGMGKVQMNTSLQEPIALVSNRKSVA